jgi:hypothetical protein
MMHDGAIEHRHGEGIMAEHPVDQKPRIRLTSLSHGAG